MNKTDQNEFDRCYAIWPKTRRKKGVAEASWAKHKPPNEFFNWILARNRYCKFAQVPNQYRRLFSTAINQKAWKDDIPVCTDDSKAKRLMKNCKCGKPTKIQTECQECYLERTAPTDWRRKILKDFYYKNLYDPNETEIEENHRLKTLGQRAIANISSLLKRNIK